MVHRQRSRILDLADEPYVCFGGRYAECGCCCCQCSRYCPSLEDPYDTREPYLCIEACCCFPFAIAANRFLIQDYFGRPEDIWSDCICCCLAAFQLTQHADELDEIASQLEERRAAKPPLQALMMEKQRLEAEFGSYGAATAALQALQGLGGGGEGGRLSGGYAAEEGKQGADKWPEQPPAMAFAGFPWFAHGVAGATGAAKLWHEASY